MAIDTATKRASALSWGAPGYVLVVPSGSISTGDMQTIAGMYSGIAAAEPAEVVAGNFYNTDYTSPANDPNSGGAFYNTATEPTNNANSGGGFYNS